MSAKGSRTFGRDGSAERAGTSRDLRPFEVGLAEFERRSRGPFDGMTGSLEGGSPVLQGIVSDLREFLLSRYSEEHARALLDEHEPVAGFRNVTPVDDATRLALDLLNSIRSATRCERERFVLLVLGPGEAKRRRGNSKGGRNRSDPPWWDQAVNFAREFLQVRPNGQRDVVRRVSQQLSPGQSDDAIRNCLRERGVLPPKQSRAK